MSKVNVNEIEPSTGTDITLGASGDTITVPSGATIVNSGTSTGFGATLSGSTNNTVVTVTGANAMIGEAKLLFDPAKLTIGNASEEDTSIVFDGHAQDYYIGLDDTDDDLKIGLGSAVGTTTHMVFNETGEITKPLQPSFMMKGFSSDITTGTAWTQITTWNTPTYDIGSNCTTTLFTAPVTGKYYFCVQILATGHAEDADLEYRFVTSNQTYIIYALKAVRNSDGSGTTYSSQNNSLITDMDANDTVYIDQICNPASSTLQDSVDQTFFCGGLIS